MAETDGVALRRDAKIELLRKVPLFERVPRKELARVAALAAEVSYPQGVALLQEGSRDDGFFILLQGEVDVRHRARLLQTLHRGQFFGEIALLADVPRTATVTTGTPVEALVISRADFKRLLGDSPALALKVLEELAYRLQTTALAGQV
jgi:CRP-like cAMP-binding protein